MRCYTEANRKHTDGHREQKREKQTNWGRRKEKQIQWLAKITREEKGYPIYVSMKPLKRKLNTRTKNM